MREVSSKFLFEFIIEEVVQMLNSIRRLWMVRSMEGSSNTLTIHLLLLTSFCVKKYTTEGLKMVQKAEYMADNFQEPQRLTDWTGKTENIINKQNKCYQ